MNFITVKSTAILSKYFGETEATLRRLFQKARDAAPCILFFDEFDAIAHNRYYIVNVISMLMYFLLSFVFFLNISAMLCYFMAILLLISRLKS
jgi:hypothetical protein